MGCSLGALMDNGHCKESGLECPKDRRCAQWNKALEMENPALNHAMRTEPSWVNHDLLNQDLAWACQEYFDPETYCERQEKSDELEKKAEQLAEEHWAYIEQVIRKEYDAEEATTNGGFINIEAYCRRVGFHYRTAMIHGFKHGVEYAKEGK